MGTPARPQFNVEGHLTYHWPGCLPASGPFRWLMPPSFPRHGWAWSLQLSLCGDKKIGDHDELHCNLPPFHVAVMDIGVRLHAVLSVLGSVQPNTLPSFQIFSKEMIDTPLISTHSAPAQP